MQYRLNLEQRVTPELPWSSIAYCMLFGRNTPYPLTVPIKNLLFQKKDIFWPIVALLLCQILNSVPAPGALGGSRRDCDSKCLMCEFFCCS